MAGDGSMRPGFSRTLVSQGVTRHPSPVTRHPSPVTRPSLRARTVARRGSVTQSHKMLPVLM